MIYEEDASLTFPRLKRREDHAFSKPIWDIRLQSIWIGFAGAYVICGSLLKGSPHLRVFSSLFLTVATLLVLLLVSHTVIAVDKAASRKTLLVALAACLFIAQKSADTYFDTNGVIFAILFATVILLLAWLPDESEMRARLAFASISSLLASLIFSGFQLLSTIVLRNHLRWMGQSDVEMFIAPHVAGILAGVGGFYVANNFIAKRIGIGNLNTTTSGQTIVRFLVAVFMGAALAVLTNYERTAGKPLGTPIGIAFAAAYMTTTTVCILASIVVTFSRSVNSNVIKILLTIAVILSAGLCLTYFHLRFCSTMNIPTFGGYNALIIIYLLPSATLAIAACVCALAFRYVCWSLYYHNTEDDW